MPTEDNPSNLHLVEGQFRVSEITPHSRHQFPELGGKNRRGIGVGIRLALIPEHATHLPACRRHLLKHRAIKGSTTLVFQRGIPLAHGGAAVG